MRAAVNRPLELAHGPRGGWWLAGWASRRIMAGVTDRTMTVEALLGRLPAGTGTVSAEQVHGASLAVIERLSGTALIPGCDALITRTPGIALLIRTADCLPVYFADPDRGVVGLAHAGWRGLAAGLLPRVVAAFARAAGTPPEALRVAIGPSIRADCYTVGPEFQGRFGRFVRPAGSGWTCDLTGVAAHQLAGCGVRTSRIADCGWCTSCETDRWFSLRKEGPSTGRLVSVIVLKP